MTPPTETIEYTLITIRTIDGMTISGKVNISSADRVSDIFTRADQLFIVMVDATTRDGTAKTLFVNKQHIIWVEPHDE